MADWVRLQRARPPNQYLLARSLTVILCLLSPHCSSKALGRDVAEEVLLERPPNDGQTCSDWVPKVALMFLSKDKFPLGPAYLQWLSQATNLVPRHSVETAWQTHAKRENLKRIKRDCLHPSGKSAIQRQNLFSIYIHTPPTARGISPSSPWHDSLISNRIMTAYGEASIMEATRLMLREALEDESNQRFVILSESDVPLYSALMTYQQLMHESRSRVAACQPGDGRMITPAKYFGLDYGSQKITHGQWRYSLHRASFLRKHALLVANEIPLHAHIKKHCGFRKNRCSTDEHYVPILLSRMGLEGETDCVGRLSAEIYDTGTSHPHTFRAEDMHAEIFQKSRVAYGCRNAVLPTYSELEYEFIDLEKTDLEDDAVIATLDLNAGPRKWQHTLPPECAMTVRKVHASSMLDLQQLYKNCTNGLAHLASDRDCKF